MTTTATDRDDMPPFALWDQIRLRAQWLRGLSPEDRDELDGATLREVDARFDAWMDLRVRVGDDGGG